MFIILAAAEYCGRYDDMTRELSQMWRCNVIALAETDALRSRTHHRRQQWLQPRDVPHAITAAVVTAGLGIIVADGVFSQVRQQRSEESASFNARRCRTLNIRRFFSGLPALREPMNDGNQTVICALQRLTASVLESAFNSRVKTID
jgi:hypothetical protein